MLPLLQLALLDCFHGMYVEAAEELWGRERY
jgi:hypothetical protein